MCVHSISWSCLYAHTLAHMCLHSYVVIMFVCACVCECVRGEGRSLCAKGMANLRCTHSNKVDWMNCVVHRTRLNKIYRIVDQYPPIYWWVSLFFLFFFFLFDFILLGVSCRVGACFFQIHNNFRCHRNRTYQHYGIIEITSEIICSKSNEFQSNSSIFSRIEFPVVVKTERQLRVEAARQQQQ